MKHVGRDSGGVRYTDAKIAIIIAGCVAAVFAATFTIESLRQRDELRRLHEKVLASHGEFIGVCYCPVPPWELAFCLASFALPASPIVYALGIASTRLLKRWTGGDSP